MKLLSKHILIILGLGSLLVLSGCQSPQTPPPSSMPSPPSPPSSSPPSQPSSSPPSQPSSSPPSQPSSSPPSQPSSSPPSKPGAKAAQLPQQSSSQQTTAQADGKTQAAKDVLAKAGEQLAKAGEALQVPDSADASDQQPQSSSTAANQQPAEQSTESSAGEPAFPDEQNEQSASSQPSFPDEQNEQSASSQPSFPDEQNDRDASSQASNPEEQTDQSASSQAGSRTEPNAEQSGAETNPGQVAESQSGDTPQDQSTGNEGQPGDSPSGNKNETGSPDQDQLAAEIQAIKNAILTAGEALQTASETMADVQPGADNQAAEGALADARVAVIIADQELQGARDDARISDASSAELQQALENANIAIVLAGGILQDADGEIPEPKNSGGSGAGGNKNGASPGTLDDELNQSIIVFNGRLEEAKESLPEQTEGSPGGIITGDTEAGELEAKSGEIQIVTSKSEQQAEPGEAGTVTQTGRMPGPGKQVAQRGAPPPDPEDIPDGQDDDIVARQLREAAMTEQDPDLKAKLWDEYRKYKTGISK